MITLLFLLCAFGIMATVHEAGHKLAAALCRVTVPKVQIGVGPSLFTFNFWRTTWTFGILPLGGYTRVHGMLASDARVPVVGDFRYLHPIQQGMIVLGGPLGNLVLASSIHQVLCLMDGGSFGEAWMAAACAPFTIGQGVLALWADAIGIHIDGMDLRTMDGTVRGMLHTLATGSFIVALLNLVPTPVTDGGRLLKLIKGQ